MRLLFKTLFICIGFYLVSYSGSLLILRWLGHGILFSGVECLMKSSPYISSAILIFLGIFMILKDAQARPQLIFAKIILTLFISLVPLSVDFFMINITYRLDPPLTRNLWGFISPMEWVILFVGMLLLGIGYGRGFAGTLHANHRTRDAKGN